MPLIGGEGERKPFNASSSEHRHSQTLAQDSRLCSAARVSSTPRRLLRRGLREVDALFLNVAHGAPAALHVVEADRLSPAGVGRSANCAAICTGS